VALCAALPVAQLIYALRFDGFVQPSHLSEDARTEIALGSIVLVVAATAVLSLGVDRTPGPQR